LQTVVAAFQMALQHTMFRGIAAQARVPGATPNFNPFGSGSKLVYVLLASLVYFVAVSLTQAATAYAVGEVYLGRATTIKAAFQATIGRWLAYMGIAMWQLGSFIWLPAAIMVPAVVLTVLGLSSLAVLAGILVVLGGIGGVVGGFILLLRNTLAIPATVIERLKIRATMRRSKVLTSGTKGRIFLVIVISFCLYMVVGILQMPLSMIMAFALIKGHDAVGAQAGLLGVGFLGQSVVTPVAMIGFTLIYFDQRVRNEAFDIAVLLGEEQMVSAGAPVVETTAEEVAAAPVVVAEPLVVEAPAPAVEPPADEGGL
jgi:hypothetical protein